MSERARLPCLGAVLIVRLGVGCALSLDRTVLPELFVPVDLYEVVEFLLVTLCTQIELVY